MLDLSMCSFINSRIRAMFSDLMDPAEIEKLDDTRDVEEAFSLLKRSPYALLTMNTCETANHLRSVEKEFIKHDIGIHRKIMANLWGDPLCLAGSLLERYELEEVKTLLRAWHRNLGAQGRDTVIHEAFVHDIDHNRVLFARDLQDLLDAFKGTPYHTPIEAGWGKYQETDEFFYVEAALDQDHFNRIWQQVDHFPVKDRDMVSRLMGIMIDMENISSMMQLKHYFGLIGGHPLRLKHPRRSRSKERTLHSRITEEVNTLIRNLVLITGTKMDQSKARLLEAVLYKKLFKESRQVLGGGQYSIATIMAYLVLKSAETHRIMSILYSKSGEQAANHIRKSLLLGSGS